MKAHRTILFLLYAVALAGAVLLASYGYRYYVMPIIQRPHSPQHEYLKPGGLWGHGVGILGSSMMLLLFLYSARKRQLFGLRMGKIRYWLNIHIFFGIMGPVFVTLHTSFKFGGIVSISYFSMLAVMFSGFIGRYLYVQIPRALSGEELSLKEAQSKHDLLTRMLSEEYHLDERTLKRIDRLAALPHIGDGWSNLLRVVRDDLGWPMKMHALKRDLRRRYDQLPAERLHTLLAIIQEKSILQRKMKLLSSIQRLFHYWHVAHKPFAYVMIIIMFIHVGVTLLFGYKWIF